MKPMTHEEYRAHADTYAAGRWAYWERVISWGVAMQPSTLLEIGPWKRPLFAGCDLLVGPQAIAPIAGYPQGVRYKHDITNTPWPIDDKAYDVLIACQVWEHLRRNEAEAFCEARRVARTVILTFPWYWDCPKDPIHHNVTAERIFGWTAGVLPSAFEIVGEPARYLGIWHFGSGTS